ncbi:hypothetical protein SAMN05443507_11829 [Alicyclobacillus tolerans]|uniref:Uncharacterized protein n=1 Tax=Alicyclobacillus tolerans TaxID=90970 RepID=A0A1M6U196_9BACL|nr:hypothetical protein SAMN05443507_11829 [Alicyclobacillus montanus]
MWAENVMQRGDVLVATDYLPYPVWRVITGPALIADTN